MTRARFPVLIAALIAALVAAATPSLAQSKAKAQNVPEIPYDSVPNFFKLPPNLYFGEGIGIATNSKGHVFVYTRSGDTRLFEFDQNGAFVREIGQGLYGLVFAHAVRVDKDDNVWIVDEGSNMVIKFNPAGRVVMTIGRRPEAVEELTNFTGQGAYTGANKPYSFNRPTDVAWDSHDNVFVTDGYGNSRVVKIAPGGHWLKWVGTWGTGPNQFNIVHSVAVDAQDNVYAADRNNHRIQVYDNNLNFIRSITGMGAPWGLCIPRPDASGKQIIYSSDGTSGRLYKIDLASGKVVGWAQTSLGRGEDDAGRLVHEIGCKDPDVVYLGSAILWNVTKVTIKQ